MSISKSDILRFSKATAQSSTGISMFDHAHKVT